MKTSIVAILLSAAAVGACAFDDLEIEHLENEITYGQYIPLDHKFAVKLEIDTADGVTTCTGVILSEHWILTAAHCLDDAIADEGTYANDRLVVRYQSWNSGFPVIAIYGTGTSGAASLYPHPSWSGGNAAYDFGLVRLYASGISSPDKARIWYDADNPWDSSDFLYIAGFGRGTFGTYVSSCAQALNDGKGRWGDFEFTGSQNSQYGQATSIYSTPCAGDSGGPWWTFRGSYDLVTHIHSSSSEVVGGIAQGSMIRPKWQWVIDTSVAKGIPLSCPTYSTGGYQYKRCTE